MTAEYEAAFSRHVLPELCKILLPLDERAQGRPGADLAHGPPAEKKQAAVTTGSAKTSGLPCATVYGLYALSPGTGCLAPVVRTLVKASELDLSTGRPGPHDFVVRADRARLAQPSRPSQPASTYRDDAYVPLR